MKLSKIVCLCTAALCLALAPLALTASAAHAQQPIALPLSDGPIALPGPDEPIGQIGHPGPNIWDINSVRIAEWRPPLSGRRGGAVKVYLKNEGSVMATNVVVSLVLREGGVRVSQEGGRSSQGGGRGSGAHTYSVTISSLSPNQGKWVSISGFQWPHVSWYIAYLKVGNNITEKFQF